MDEVVTTFTRRPVEVEGCQYLGTDESAAEIHNWISKLPNGGAAIDTQHIQHLWDYAVGAFRFPNGKYTFARKQERQLIIELIETRKHSEALILSSGDWLLYNKEKFWIETDANVKLAYDKKEKTDD